MKESVMALRDPRPGLRTIHNGSNAVAKASVVVPAGSDLTVPEEVAAQLFAQASGAFKDGPAPEPLLAALALAKDAPADDAPAEEAPAKKAAKRK
jgi:hypothetical protein